MQEINDKWEIYLTFFFHLKNVFFILPENLLNRNKTQSHIIVDFQD